MSRYSLQELNRFRWRCRRGMAELDILLVPFFEDAFEALEAGQQTTFIGLLEEEDPVLWEWFSERSRPPGSEMLALVQLILKRVRP
ncbi:MAG: succinate dehydrogenase assembly factor 2 [Gammaproteobacteria bacterium]|nr:succinate dehydrogenase assembly factor 2 [Gammaproteobacteria bacterium]